MKNNIIKASEEVFPIDKEMSLDEQSDQILRQIGFKFGANWAIEKACELLKANAYSSPDGSRVTFYQRLNDFLSDFKKAMEGGNNEN